MNPTAANLQGQFLRSLAVESSAQVTPLVITAKRITLEWSQDGKTGHLDATSQDGIHFHAQFGFAAQDFENKCELTLYRAGEEQLLFGTWWDNVAATQGILAFRLPTKVAAARSGRLAQPSQPSQPNAERPAVVTPPTASTRQPADRPQPASPRQETSGLRPIKQPAPVAAPLPMVPASAQADHLLAMTPEEFAGQDRAALERELASAPLSAVFKLSHNALAPEMKRLAGSVFAKRYGGLTAAGPPGPAPRPPEPPEFKAIKRRSSRHGKNH